MYKTYTVNAFPLGGQPAFRADTIPPLPAQSGPKLTLDKSSGQNVYVQGAGHDGTIDLTTRDFIYTTGLFQCFAVCAVWEKVDETFQHGYLAHVSSPGPSKPKLGGPQPFFRTAIANIPDDAWIVVGVGVEGWVPIIAKALQDGGHADDHIWIYNRAEKTDVGFGIDKYGRFGET